MIAAGYLGKTYPCQCDEPIEAHSLSVIAISRCCLCGATHDLYYGTHFGWEYRAPETPEGWHRLDDKLYCQDHDVTIDDGRP